MLNSSVSALLRVDKVHAPFGMLQVVVHCWGQDVKDLMPSPDVITGADVVYQQEHFDALVTTLHHLAAPHTLIYLAFKIRGKLQPTTQQLVHDNPLLDFGYFGIAYIGLMVSSHYRVSKTVFGVGLFVYDAVF